MTRIETKSGAPDRGAGQIVPAAMGHPDDHRQTQAYQTSAPTAPGRGMVLDQPLQQPVELSAADNGASGA